PTMTQFEVFRNPAARVHRVYPFVVVLQADLAQRGSQRVVAPVAPRAGFPAIPGRLTPIIGIEREEFVLLVNALETVSVRGLNGAVVSLASRRNDIVAGIDYLFFGV